MYICADERLTKLDNNLSKIVRMAGELEKSFVAHSVLIMSLSEAILLNIADRLHNEPCRKQDYTCNIPASTKAMLAILRHVRRI